VASGSAPKAPLTVAERASSAGGRPLRILFSMRNFWYVKLFESVVRELASRGHRVRILAERGENNERSRDWNEAAVALASDELNVTFDWAPRPVDDDWTDLRLMIRLGIDHLRFLRPEYTSAPMLGDRARRRTPNGVVRLADAPFFRSRLGRWLIGVVLRAAERAVPVSPPLAQAIASEQADVILVTPLVTLGSEQVDVLRTARHLGVPSVLCVGSWDHLSSKALIRQWPDRVFVWNRTQTREAAEFHGVPPERVVVTGAQCFDQWFDRRPSLGREEFCRKVGLDPDRPFILYVCSALFEGSPNEAEFALRWARAVRSSDDSALRDAGLLVRPHPKRGFEWEQVSFEGLENAGLWPPTASAPFDAPSKSDYFDSMFHSAAIVGLNTSALIEGGIVGRAVHTILLPEFHDNQEGTLHFRYLLDGGLLRVSRDLDSHVAMLSASLATADSPVHHNRAFIEAFVRPLGLAQAATPIFADAVEAVASLKTTAVSDPWWIRGLRVALTPLARGVSGTFIDQIARERRRSEKARSKATRKAMVLQERQLKSEARMREREERLRAARAEHLRVQAEERRMKTERREQKARSQELRAAQEREELAAKRRAKEASLAEARRRRALENRKKRIVKSFNRGKALASPARFRKKLAGYFRRMKRLISASR
jgi:hypothetical protein